MYLPPAGYTLIVSQWGMRGNVGYNASESRIEISPGESITELDFILNRSAVPLNESGGTMGLAIFATTSLFIITDRKKTHLNAGKRHHK
jgi:hypothetical protein